jgi:hypothetical protein
MGMVTINDTVFSRGERGMSKRIVVFAAIPQENFKVPPPRKMEGQKQAEACTLSTFRVQASACWASWHDFEILLGHSVFLLVKKPFSCKIRSILDQGESATA